jgi:hypothetical protein
MIFNNAQHVIPVTRLNPGHNPQTFSTNRILSLEISDAGLVCLVILQVNISHLI